MLARVYIVASALLLWGWGWGGGGGGGGVSGAIIANFLTSWCISGRRVNIHVDSICMCVLNETRSMLPGQRPAVISGLGLITNSWVRVLFYFVQRCCHGI
jgi:hypothetical protein